MDGIFVDRRGLRILVDMVFGVFSERSIRKIEHGNDASQPELSLEGVVPSDVSRGDVERYIVDVSPPLFRRSIRPVPQVGAYGGRSW